MPLLYTVGAAGLRGVCSLSWEEGMGLKFKRGGQLQSFLLLVDQTLGTSALPAPWLIGTTCTDKMSPILTRQTYLSKEEMAFFLTHRPPRSLLLLS